MDRDRLIKIDLMRPSICADDTLCSARTRMPKVMQQLSGS